MDEAELKARIEGAHEMLNEVLADRMVGVLNELLELDYETTVKLVFGEHIPCNQAFADHPSVQVREIELGKYGVRTMGLLNGLVGTYPDGWGRIGGEFEHRCPGHGAQDPARTKDSDGLCPQLVELPESQGGGQVCCDEELKLHLVRFSRTPAEKHQG